MTPEEQDRLKKAESLERDIAHTNMELRMVATATCTTYYVIQDSMSGESTGHIPMSYDMRVDLEKHLMNQLAKLKREYKAL